MRRIAAIALGLALALAGTDARALSDSDIPEPLRPWKDWVLHGHEDINCPAMHNDAKKRFCAWPGRLELTLNDVGGRFSQDWRVFRKGWAVLPGDGKRWPQDIRVDGEPAVVSERGGAPAIRLAPGRHRIEGTFAWTRLPQSLPVPKSLGLVALSINDTTVAFPDLDEKGMLWLGERRGGSGTKTQQDALALQVFRHIDDDLPMRVTTRIKLDVSGRHREILLGPAMLDGFTPLALRAALPTRIEPDGRLRMQVRPGNWTVDLVARYPGSVQALSRPQGQAAPWPASEVWAFNAHNDLRLVEVTGAPAIDPRQTTLPPGWRKLPAYLIQPDTKLAFATKRRGNPDPVPNQLRLKRTLWLDFDGGGYSVRDAIRGKMHAGWRLEMPPPLTLGRVSVNGRDQFITRAEGSNKAGVELREGSLNLLAESRIEGRSRTLGAVGWDHDMSALDTTLYLPPGWRAFHITGMDKASTTWLQRWSMLDLFLVLIIALAISRLWRWPWGVAALAMLALTYHEPDAPRWIWLNMLAAIALLRAVPEGIFRKLLGFYRDASLLAFVVLALPFVVGQVRMAIYPQLEPGWDHWRQMSYQQGPALGRKADAGLAAALESAPSVAKPRSDSKSYRSKSKVIARNQLSNAFQFVDPSAVNQTGPGIPDWNRHAVRLYWNGPVKRDQTLGLTLMPPWMTAVWRVMGVALIGALTLLMLASRLRILLPYLRAGAATIIIGAATFIPASPPAMAADTPPPALLDELRKRLLETPACFPQCAQLPELALAITGDAMTGRLAVHAEENVAVPLPGDGRFWRLRQVRIDGKPVAAMRMDREHRLWVQVPKGRHTVEMDGTLADVATLSVPLTLRVRRVSWKSDDDWRVEGIDENGVPSAQLQLIRPQKRTDAPSKTFEPSRMPPFARVERTLALGLDWRVHTRVVRDAASQGAVTIRVPLLPGESVTTEDAKVDNGTVLVNLTPSQRAYAWSATLAREPALKLDAAKTGDWVETWQLDASPIWHLESDGIAPIFHQDPNGVWRPTWRPWPGESVTLTVSRPSGVKGQSLTIDRSVLDLRPGQRATDATLTLGLRSSQGGQHAIRLPKEVTLDSVTINGRRQPIRAREGVVTLPVAPGNQTVVLKWQANTAIGMRYKTPTIALGAASVNSRINVHVPDDRWTLFATGPTLGPAVLFWGVLLVVVAIALGLGRTSITPLNALSWGLLGVGLTQAPVPMAILIVVWLFALGARARLPETVGKITFNTVQVVLAVLTLAALGGLVFAVQHGLLGAPEMQVSGNGSHAHLLRWYQDHLDDALPEASVISVSMWFYRLLMLAWALWLAYSLLGWLRWGWSCYAANGLWRPFSLAFWRRRRRASEATPTEAGQA